MNLVLDLDGCIFDFNTAYAKLLAKSREGDKLPAGWKTDPALLAPVWDWDTYHGYSGMAQSEVWNESILPENKKFWLKLPLLKEAKTALLRLGALSKQGHGVYFLTHRMGQNAKYQTEKALYEAGISYPTVLLCDPIAKPHIAQGLGCNIFIEDKLETANAAASLGLTTYLIDAPYNRSGDRLGTVVKDVREVLERNDLWKTVLSF